tara:strand:+ start:140 stop:748 length:609 start_codon:yes stop_codon:yes gene_type:complete
MKAYIYKIYDNTNGNVYYGSTKQLLCKRIAGHRADYKKYLNEKFAYVKSFDILKNNDYSYCVVEEVEYENKWELLNKERYYIENNKCINKCIPNRTNKEYKEDNKEKIKEYYEDNKETLKEYQKIYQQDNKEIIKEYKKEYYENNKEILSEKNKIYRESNKEIINQKQKEKITCECGCEITKSNLIRHKKTKKHLLFLETLQ